MKVAIADIQGAETEAQTVATVMHQDFSGLAVYFLTAAWLLGVSA
ncbi:hypothetical protein ACN2MM_04735 [Alkalilimnicola ehrlichii MLHE-1]|nr:hypothetical protein [Alkalilimnicola ehrlichii]